MKKKQRLCYALGIISFMIGALMLIICSLNKKLGLQLNIAEKIIPAIFSILFILGALACFSLYLHNFIKNDESLILSEHDERNIMIRGKASEKSTMLTSFVMLIIEIILMCIGDYTSACIVAIAMFLCTIIQLSLILYYQKKY